MAKVTRLGAEGYGVERIRSFAGKEPSAGGPHPVGIITRLSADGYGAKRAGSFAGKGASGPSGTLAVTEGADSAAFTGTVLVKGTLAVTEGADTAAFAGTVPGAATPSAGTGGGGVRHTGAVIPLSRIKGRKYTAEENRRKRELERLEAAIRAAEGIAPPIDPATAVDARAYAAASRELEKLLAEAKAAQFERDDEDDIEFLLLAD